MKNGYSLIEILVVLTIISIFSAIIIVDYGKQKSDNDLSFAIKQVAEDIRIAESSTVNTLKFNTTIPPGGYGIEFSITNNTSYILFADLNSNMKYDSGSDGVVKTATLPQGIVIDSVETIPGTIDGDADIVFTPPYGVIFINEKNASNFATVILNLQLRKASTVCPSTDCKTLEFTSEGKLAK